MALFDLKGLPLGYGFAQTRAVMREIIDSNRHSVIKSRRTMAEAREVLARADDVLSWQLTDRRCETTIDEERQIKLEAELLGILEAAAKTGRRA